MSLNTTSQTQEAITALDTLVKQNGALLERVLDFDGEVADAYDYLESKGAVMPEDKTIENLPSTIAQIVDAHIYIRLDTMTVQNNEENRLVDLSNILITGASIYSLVSAKPYVKRVIAPYTTSNLTNVQGAFYNNGGLESVDLSRLNTESVTTFYEMLGNNPSIEEIDASSLNTASATRIGRFIVNCPILKKVNLGVFNCGNVTDAANMFQVDTALETIVGGKTYEEVRDNNITTLTGLNINATNLNINVTKLDRASLRAIINGLADRTGQSALTLTIGATLLAKLSADDIAVATNKNWTIS